MIKYPAYTYSDAPGVSIPEAEGGGGAFIARLLLTDGATCLRFALSYERRVVIHLRRDAPLSRDIAGSWTRFNPSL